MTAKKLSAVILALTLLVSLFSCSFALDCQDTEINDSDTNSPGTVTEDPGPPLSSGFPFADLTVEDIESVTYVFGTKNRIAITDAETEEFVSCIRKIEIGNKTDNIPDGFGSSFEILKTNGDLIRVTSGGSVTIINEEIYICNNDSDLDYREFANIFWLRILELTS